MAESTLFKVTGQYPVTLPREKTPMQVLSEEFTRYLRHLFYRTPPDDYFCSTKKYFTNKLEKPLRKNNKKWERLVRKQQNDTLRKKLSTNYLKSSHPFTIRKFLYSSFLCFPWYIESQPRWNQHWHGEGDLSNLKASTSTSARRARRSDATKFKQNKRIFLITLPRTRFTTEVCSYFSFP